MRQLSTHSNRFASLYAPRRKTSTPTRNCLPVDNIITIVSFRYTAHLRHPEWLILGKENTRFQKNCIDMFWSSHSMC